MVFSIPGSFWGPTATKATREITINSPNENPNTRWFLSRLLAYLGSLARAWYRLVRGGPACAVGRCPDRLFLLLGHSRHRSLRTGAVLAAFRGIFLGRGGQHPDRARI